MVVKVIDSMMGTGKSEYTFRHMYDSKDEKFIYITPYLDEISRLLYSGDGSRSKWYKYRRFREPKHLGEGKLESLHKLLIEGYNITTTHSLFKMCTKETLELIEAGGYTLVLDEALDVVNIFDVNLTDYNMLLSEGILQESDAAVKWVDYNYSGKLSEYKILFQTGEVRKVKTTGNIALLAWNLFKENFSVFKDVYILTYLFDASHIKYYFDINNIEYEKYAIQYYSLVKFEDRKPYNKQFYKDNIHIYEGPLNSVGDKHNALSLNWFKNHKSTLVPKLKNDVYNYMHHKIKAKSKDILWTTFKAAKKSLEGNGYRTSFIPCNCKATNEYKDRHVVAYCCNRYISPDYIHYFALHNVQFNEDAFALAEMLQFIWRSAIRRKEPIDLYLPSSKMRELMYSWLEDSKI
jgi:hypothetical protein